MPERCNKGKIKVCAVIGYDVLGTGKEPADLRNKSVQLNGILEHGRGYAVDGGNIGTILGSILNVGTNIRIQKNVSLCIDSSKLEDVVVSVLIHPSCL